MKKLHVHDTSRTMYLKKEGMDSSPNGQNKTLRHHSQTIWRIYRAHNINLSAGIDHIRRVQDKSKGQTLGKPKKHKTRHLEKFGISLPTNTREALLLDRKNGNTLWAEAILKEMKSLDLLNVFKYHLPDTQFTKEAGWQYAPLRMIFDIKQQDLATQGSPCRWRARY